jgi:hypothetical protein
MTHCTGWRFSVSYYIAFQIYRTLTLLHCILQLWIEWSRNCVHAAPQIGLCDVFLSVMYEYYEPRVWPRTFWSALFSEKYSYFCVVKHVRSSAERLMNSLTPSVRPSVRLGQLENRLTDFFRFGTWEFDWRLSNDFSFLLTGTFNGDCTRRSVWVCARISLNIHHREECCLHKLDRNTKQTGSKSLWRWHINTIISLLDIIHRPVFI